MAQKNVSNDELKRLEWGMHDAVIDGVVHQDIPAKMVYVSQQSELSNYEGYPVGTIAATYGFGSMWQLKPDGTWASMA